jgi:geranylgeranyl reductase family protein
MNRFDVAVIGAGPAGAWTAYLLASRGASVALVDPSHPREKPCGGGVTGRALSLVSEAIASALPAVAVRSARFVESSAGRSVGVAFDIGRERPLVVASRTDFDGLLLAAAVKRGATHVPVRAAAIAHANGEWRISTSDGRTLGAGLLVGADGANSLVRRSLAGAFQRHQLSIATGFFARGMTSSEIVIEFTSDPAGYLWSFPRPDHLAIGICAQADEPVTAGQLRATTARWIEAARLAPAATLQPYAWPIPSLSARDFTQLIVSGPDWLLVGDAAGLVDPITREGIFFALQSAAFASDALSADASERPRRYAKRVADEIAGELARAARIKAHFFRPQFIRLLLEGLGRSARIRSVMADLIAGRQRYATLKWRLLETFELGLAWKLVTDRDSRRALARAHQAV